MLLVCGAGKNENQTVSSIQGRQNNLTETETTGQTDDMVQTAKVIIVYFSWSENTRSIANEIRSQTGADIFELVPATPYSDDYNTVLDESLVEQNNQAILERIRTIEDFGSYDVVYVGFCKMEYGFNCVSCLSLIHI